MKLTDIENYGIIGAGGAGFPTHVKLAAKADTVIMNAAECEPLLHKDMEIISRYCDTVISGIEAVTEMTGAGRALIGIKKKHKEEIELLNSKAGGKIIIVPLDDVYPAGDEVTLIYMTTQRVVAPGALPISAGCVVQNVETLYNIGSGAPVTEKFVSVAGAVEEPATVRVPVGTQFGDILDAFKFTTDDYAIISGGLMMGKLETDLTRTVSKRTGALIVLPSDHHCVIVHNKYSSEHVTDIMAKAGCDQCSHCTELCPRYLLGQPIKPETAMRNRMFSREDQPAVNAGSFACCECNLCTMYSCPEGLNPRGAAVIEKRLCRENNIKWTGKPAGVHPMYEYRRVPTKRLMQKLDVMMFEDKGPLKELDIRPEFVRIALDQHIGAPAGAVVAENSVVKKNDLIGLAKGKVSANVHASIDGIVTKVTNKEITIQRK